jgi:hypothetical protein
LAKKDNLIKSLVLLGAIVGIGFALFENREALGQKLTFRPKTQDELKPESPQTTPNGTKPIISAGDLNKSPQQLKTQVIVQAPSLSTVSTRIVETAPQPTRRETPRRTISQKQQESFDEINRTPQVRKPSFLAPQDILNPKAFNKRKFGIDTDVTKRALQKSASDRSIEERKNIAQERARQTFDSRSISNF